MIRGRRPLLYALLALAVPLPALAIGGGEPAGPASLSVSASLGGCGLASTSIMCEIDASWNSLEEADSYTASVTAPDGSVTDFGSVGAGSASVYVPYVGDGTYSVQVTAWGQPEEPGSEPEVIARENSSPEPDPGGDANDGVDPGTLSVKPDGASESSANSAGDPGADAATPTAPGETTPTDPVEPPVDCTTPVTPEPPAATTTPDPGTTKPEDSADERAQETTSTTEEAAPPPPPADPACP